MNKKMVATGILWIFCAMTVWAGGRQANEAHYADDPSGFTSTIDTSEKKPGKYNFYLEALDKAGNSRIAGPENIYIDPESDLPIATVINPRQNMHVQGNLNVVGISVDDDGVSHVEIVISRGADGRGEELLRTRAEGAEFWSYFLDTSNELVWPDGVYTISAWAVDINGLSGISEEFRPRQWKIHNVAWNLDRRKPETRVTSHDVGALVAGRINLRGTVFDGNGIKSLRYSTDEGENYTSVPLSFDRRSNIYNYTINIDTRRFDEGPAVIWFQAQDGMGTSGTAAHLLFVNNTAPDVGIIYPEPDAYVNGLFTVAGYAMHPVGIKSITWKLGRETGEIPLVIGNDWWAQQFDIRGQRLTSADLEIRVEDLSGNVTVEKRRLRIDQNAGMPKIELEEPVAGGVLEGNDLTIKGYASNDKGIASIFYSIDGQDSTEIPCSGYFHLTIPGVSAGTHSLEVWAKDINDVTGPKVQVKNIVVPGSLPEPRIATISSGMGRNLIVSEFYTGMEIMPDQRMTLGFTIQSDSAISSGYVTVGSNPPVALRVRAGREGLHTAETQLPPDPGYGLTKIELSVTDRFGREAVWEDYVYFGSGSGTGFQWVRPDLSIGDGRILIPNNYEPLIGLGGGLLSSAQITGSGADNFSVSVDDFGRLSLIAGREGSFGPLTIEGRTRGGQSISSSPFNVLADFSPPSINIIDNPDGKWFQRAIPVQFSVSDSNRINSVEYSVDLGSSWQPLLRADEITLAGPHEKILDVSFLQDGSININIRVVDEANRTTINTFAVHKDTVPPNVSLITPVADARVNGTIRMGFAVEEVGLLKRVAYHRPAIDDGGVQIPEITGEIYPGLGYPYPPTFMDVILDANHMPLDRRMNFIFEDMAGNISTFSSWHFVIDNEMDIPIVHIILPLENEVVTTDFEVSGVMYDDDAISHIYWSIDDGAEQLLEADNGFSIFLALDGLTDNEHTVTVAAEDIYGVRSRPVTRNFRVSLAEPTAEITFPDFETIVKETVRIQGVSFDENDIEMVQVSLDNGNTYNNAYGSDEWYYEFNTKILQDGPNVVFVRATDKYGISAIYANLINIDNTSPEIALDSPSDGAVTTGTVHVMGRAIDENLAEIAIELRSLDGHNISDDLRTRTLLPASIIKETLDLSPLPNGLYNIEIWAVDKAENVTRISRNVELAHETMRNFVDILYPLDNENVQGSFNLYGYVGGMDDARHVNLRINGRDMMIEEVTPAGFFRFAVTSEFISDGQNEIVVHSMFGGLEVVQSPVRNINYKSDGAWVTIDSLAMGDFAFERPWLTGRAGYELNWEDVIILEDKKADKAERSRVQSQALNFVEISFDGGRTFRRTQRTIDRETDWRYRLETGDMVEGYHYLLVRANMKNGETAVTRTLVQVDKTPPVVRLISPNAGGRYNTSIEYTALASDDVELSTLSYHLRIGDKAFYEVPGFIQGLYFDMVIPPFVKQIANDAPVIFAGGATYMDFGFGLSFFDDNVKIQMQYGMMTQDLYESLGGNDLVRYGGHVMAFKLLANVYRLPFGSFLGPDWEWLSATVALGANFSLFDLAQEGYTQSGESTWMSALLLQLEFPRVTIPKRKHFRTFSLFTEGQLWFVPTDVSAKDYGITTVIPHVIMGVRAYVF
ncbi:MAG: Ig-like domain-containing protein [Treponema sp.]|nr:Ig-like domain-containing protein [Treponema sp.]